MEKGSEFCAELLNKFETITKKPENYLGLQNNVAEEIKVLVKSLYDFTKIAEVQSKGDALPELIIQDFDEEQIWQELELQNDGLTNSLTSDIALLLARKDRLNFPVQNTIDEESDKSDDEDDGSKSETAGNESVLSSDNELEENINVEHKREKLHTAQKKSKSVVDDRFFKLQDLERFLSNEDRKAERGSRKNESDDDENSDDESVDLFEDMRSDGETEKESYADFFDDPDGNNENIDKDVGDEEGSYEGEQEEAEKESEGEDEQTNDKRVRFNLLDNEDDFSNEETATPKTKEMKSSYENRQERLKTRISKLESEALGEKPWQLKGEVAGTSRPQNSLLEEVVEFDMTSRPAPIITEQTTLKLEDLITQRIKDKAWDDVERKIKPVETPQEYKKKLVLNQEKSKRSLAQVYEDEYLKQRDVAPDNEDKVEEEPESHREIRVMLSSLFAKLDALSNFHYTPKPAAPEVKIITNVAAITIEEVAPVATTNATLLAPEEVKAKSKGDVMSKQERTSTDRKRERRHKKMMQRDRQQEKEKRDKLIDKLKPGLGNKYSKEKTAKLLTDVVKDRNVSKMEETTTAKSVRSSTAFFSQLQDEVTTNMRAKIANGNKKRKIEKMSAKSFKL